MTAMRRHRWVVALAALGSGAGCVPTRPPPGMVVQVAQPHAPDPTLLELSRTEPRVQERSLLVVHPRTACSGSAGMVFLDDRGSFLGAVPPGSAALLRVPQEARSLRVFSSVEVTASKGSWYLATDVAIPPFPDGILLDAQRWSSSRCGDGHYASAAPASKRELEATLSEASITWLVPEPDEGQAWLDAHHARVQELRGVATIEDPPWNTPLHARR